MARQTITRVTCDSCGQEPAEPYVLATAPRGRTPGKIVDLCPEHALPIRNLLEIGRKTTITMDADGLAPRKQRRTGRAAPARKIYTKEELDKLEAQES